MSNPDAVKRWRNNTKRRIVDSLGGSCCLCGYSKCMAALDIHHLNPAEKEFGMGGMRANPRSWERIVAELRKCVLLCSNCHSEFHADLVKIPKSAKRFNEDYRFYSSIAKQV